MFAGKARSIAWRGVFGRCSTRVGFILTHKHKTRLARFAMEKHFSLLETLINYVTKKFHKIYQF